MLKKKRVRSDIPREKEVHISLNPSGIVENKSYPVHQIEVLEDCYQFHLCGVTNISSFEEHFPTLVSVPRFEDNICTTPSGIRTSDHLEGGIEGLGTPPLKILRSSVGEDLPVYTPLSCY